MGDPNGVRICDGGCESAHNLASDSPDVSRGTFEQDNHGKFTQNCVQYLSRDTETVREEKDL